MSSWIRCKCGALVHTNLFSGANIGLIVTDTFLDTLPGDISRDEAIGRLAVGAETSFIRCKACPRVFVLHSDGTLEIFAPDPVSESES